MLPKVLSIAGFDPTSGAGIIADMKTAAAFKCYGISVITALTIQNSSGVEDLKIVETEFLGRQIGSLLSDVAVDSVKIGILMPAESIMAVSALLSSRGIRKIVVDPLIASSSGFAFQREEGLAAIREHLFPIAEVITPNISEASLLSGIKVSNLESMKSAAKELFSRGARNILIKGGHLEGMATDLLYDGKRFSIFDAPKLKTADFHGLGCAFSMALACLLARGETLFNSVDLAKKYIRKQMSYPLQVGKGRAFLDHIGK